MAVKLKPGQKSYSEIFTPEMVAFYQEYPDAYVEDIIFKNIIKDPDEHNQVSDQQREMLYDLKERRKGSYKSGRGIGKGTTAAWMVNYWITLYQKPDVQTQVVCTAPSAPTLFSALWPEIKMWLKQSLHGHLFDIGERKIKFIERPDYVWAEVRTARDKENFSGIHAPFLLVIADEASGCADEILQTLDDTLTSGKYNKFFMFSNPTKVNGFFYDTHENPRIRKMWAHRTFSALDSPFTDKEKLDTMIDIYGIDHPIVKVSVLGEFPDSNEEAFISLVDIMQATYRDIDNPSGDIEIGLDVARMGDDKTVLFWRQGNKVHLPKVMNKSKGPEVETLVYDTVDEIRTLTGYKGVIKVKIDDIGLGGIVCDYLERDRKHNIEVIPIGLTNKRKEDDSDYFDELSDMWGILKNNIDKISLPDIESMRKIGADRLIEELSARRWDGDTGKIRIESKTPFKKEFGYSPDFSDALTMCFYNKKLERTVIKNFDPLDKSFVKNKIAYIGETKLCSIWYTKDLYCSVVYAAWDGYNLTFYDEYTGDDALIFIASDIRNHLPLNKIIGNDLMFGKSTEDISSKLRKMKVNVFENYMYDETGAIETMNNLITERRFSISYKCEKTIDQVSRWRMDTGKRRQDVDYGLCYAMSNLISFLKRKIEKKEQIRTIPSYNYEEKKKALDQAGKGLYDLNANSWQSF